MFRGDRLIALLEARDISQSELARRVGISQATIWKLTKEPSQGSKHTHRIARELGTSPEYLMGETDDPAPAGGVAQTRQSFGVQPGAKAQDSDTVELNELDLAYGMGSTFVDDLPVKALPRAFSRAWLRNFTDSPVDKLFFARGLGDSMAPTIQSADILLIDTAQVSPRMADQLWAVAMNGMGMIKRLRAGREGAMRLMADNPQVREETAYDEELFVIGRVVAIVRKT